MNSYSFTCLANSNFKSRLPHWMIKSTADMYYLWTHSCIFAVSHMWNFLGSHGYILRLICIIFTYLRQHNNHFTRGQYPSSYSGQSKIILQLHPSWAVAGDGYYWCWSAGPREITTSQGWIRKFISGTLAHVFPTVWFYAGCIKWISNIISLPSPLVTSSVWQPKQWVHGYKELSPKGGLSLPLR